MEKKTASPCNPILSANMKRLLAGRSIEALRQEMKEKGLAIGTQTLHRAVLGAEGNRLASLQKIAQFFEVAVDQLLQPDLGEDIEAWPFSAELQALVSQLSPPKLLSLERAMWAHLDEEVPAEVHERLRRARASVDRMAADVQAVGNVTPQSKPLQKA